MSYPASLAKGFLHAGISSERLAERGDVWGLYARATSERLFGDADNDLVNASMALGILTVYSLLDVKDVATGKLLVSGPLRFYPRSWFRGATLIPRKSGQTTVDLAAEHISVRFYGDRSDISQLPTHLGNMAAKLSLRQNNPKMIIGVSHREAIATAARLVPGAATFTVEGYPFADDVFTFGDAARLARGRPPRKSRELYAAAISTERFIQQFRSRD